VSAQVGAVQFNQVEGVQEDAGVVPPVADAVEAVRSGFLHVRKRTLKPHHGGDAYA
jgi:hypothetical protein